MNRTRRIIHKRSKSGEPSIFGERKKWGGALSRGWKGRTSPPKNWEDLPPLEKNINKGQVLVRVT